MRKDWGRYVHEYAGETRESAEVFIECVDSTPLHPDEKVPRGRMSVRASCLQAVRLVSARTMHPRTRQLYRCLCNKLRQLYRCKLRQLYRCKLRQLYRCKLRQLHRCLCWPQQVLSFASREEPHGGGAETLRPRWCLGVAKDRHRFGENTKVQRP